MRGRGRKEREEKKREGGREGGCSRNAKLNIYDFCIPHQPSSLHASWKQDKDILAKGENQSQSSSSSSSQHAGVSPFLNHAKCFVMCHRVFLTFQKDDNRLSQSPQRETVDVAQYKHFQRQKDKKKCPDSDRSNQEGVRYAFTGWNVGSQPHKIFMKTCHRRWFGMPEEGKPPPGLKTCVK